MAVELSSNIALEGIQKMLVLNNNQQPSIINAHELLQNQFFIDATATAVKHKSVDLLSPLQDQLIYMLQQLSGASSVSLNEDIFSLGGDPLLVLKLVNQVNHSFATELTPVLLTQHSTVAALSRWINSTNV
jgi:hypothetical protein